MSEEKKIGRVIGIGGVFFKTQNQGDLKKWYEKHLGFKTNKYGTVFEFGKLNAPGKKGHLQWSPFTADSDYFDKEYMINYRVEHLEELIDQMRKDGVTIVDNIEHYDYGKFVHVRDNEGTMIELWEPVDEVFENYTEDGAVTGTTK